MKISELIKKLKEFDPNARVVLWHHWGNYKDIDSSQIEITKISHFKKQENAVKLS
jgi:hypothetical protein